MGKVKILKNNKKSQFMIIALMIFSSIILIYSTLLAISPIINKNNIEEINNAILGENYQKILSIFLYNGKSWIVGPSKTLISFLPMILSLIVIIFLSSRLIIHSVGYRTKTAMGISRIVRPIKSYQFTMIFVWIFLVLLMITMTLSLISAAPFFMGIAFQFSAANFITIDEAITVKIVQQLDGQFGQIYWLSYGAFSKLQGVNNPAQVYKMIDKVMWFIMPIIIQFLALILGFIGAIFGECSWWSINILVLKTFDFQAGTTLVDEYVKVKKPKIKEKKWNQKPKKQKPLKVKKPNLSTNLNNDEIKTIEIIEPKNYERLQEIMLEENNELIKPIEVVETINNNVEVKQEIEELKNDDNLEENMENKKIEENQRNSENNQHNRIESLQTIEFGNITEIEDIYNEKALEDKTFDPLIETKCVLFYKKIIKLLEQSDNTDTSLYWNTIKKSKEIKDSKNNDWLTISNEIEKEIKLFSTVDIEFVNLIEKLVFDSKTNFFGRYKSDLEELIEDYHFALKTWDLLAAEIKLEQILAITFRKKELLPKVGFCLKNKVLNNYKNIDQKTNVVNRLETAKNNRDFKSYRDICVEIIKNVSPIKPIISNYVNKIIYN